MYELVITACLIAAPAQCTTFELTLTRYDNLDQCARRSTVDLVRWADRKPQWRISRWTCLALGETI